jgi:mannitol-1-phosphate/altronate dehydrogenase
VRNRDLFSTPGRDICADLPVRTGYAEELKPLLDRFGNPMLDHHLEQISLDGAAKLSHRLMPLMQSNLKAGLPYSRMSTVYGPWLDYSNRSGPMAAEQFEHFSDPTLSVSELRNAMSASRS